MLSEGYKHNGAIVIADVLGTKNKGTKNDYGQLIVEYKDLLDKVKEISLPMQNHAKSNGIYIEHKMFTISDTVISLFLGNKDHALKICKFMVFLFNCARYCSRYFFSRIFGIWRNLLQ